MADRLALLIAVEAHAEPETVPVAECAAQDARALAHALEALGFAREQQLVLLDGQATRTAIESRLRKLAKSSTQVCAPAYSGDKFHPIFR